jgi:hypothetical protein
LTPLATALALPSPFAPAPIVLLPFGMGEQVLDRD